MAKGIDPEWTQVPRVQFLSSRNPGPTLKGNHLEIHQVIDLKLKMFPTLVCIALLAVLRLFHLLFDHPDRSQFSCLAV